MGEAYALYAFVLQAQSRILTNTLSFTLQIFQVRIISSSRVTSCLTVHIEHLDRVREKVLLLDENSNKSSGTDRVTMTDWYD